MSTVIRIEKNRNYVVMNNEFLRNKEMSLKAKGLLALCLSLPDTWDYSLNGLCAILKESKTAIRSTLKELEEHGHLVRNRLQNEKGMFHYEYIIYETPHIENLHAVNIDTENTYTENKTQISIKEKSIEEENIEKEIYIDIEPAILPLFKEYLEIRKSIGTPLDKKGITMLIKRLIKLSNGNTVVQRLMLENAILNRWKNIYKPKEQEIAANLEAQLNELKSFYGL